MLKKLKSKIGGFSSQIKNKIITLLKNTLSLIKLGVAIVSTFDELSLSFFIAKVIVVVMVLYGY
jgi:hypothetical protein